MADIFKGRGDGYGGDIIAELSIENGRITKAALTGEQEDEKIVGDTLERIADKVVESQSCEFDAVSGATITSTGARYAVKDAMEQAGLIECEDISATQVLETEVLVVGCGVSGIAAAMSAGENGAKVLMIDRTEVFGGNGLWADGGFFVETYLQKEAGETYTVKQAYEEAMYFANYLCDPILMRMVLGESAETLRWANSYGAGFYLLDFHKVLADEGKPFAYHCWNGNDPIGHFKAALEAMDNVEIRLGVRCSGLVQDESGAVTGAVCEDLNGRRVEIRARAVCIGTGGYIANRGMIADAVGEDVAKVLVADSPEVSDGAGIQMAWCAGAGKRGEKLLGTHGGRTGLGGFDGLPGCDLLMNLPILWINKKGRRFMNEETIYMSLFYSNVLLAQGGYAYILFDRASVEQWMEKTIPMKMHFWDRFGENGGYYCPPVKTFDQDIETALKHGLACRADSIEELADAMGIDRAVLLKTVSDYNGFVTRGDDTEFFKSAENLKYTVETGPFYAVRCNLQAQSTTGGVRVNDKLEAVTKDDDPIPGLYAGGCDAGGLYSGSYTVHSGLGISWALTSGRLEGKNAAEYSKAQR